ncbi:MAG: DciA family protein [Pseudomonadota bacterium]
MVTGVGANKNAGRPRGRASAAMAVGSFVPRITQKSFQKFGFSTTSLLTEWTGIVGQEIAGVTRPEKIKWPRLPDVRDESGVTSDRGATLILRVEAACALDIEYRRSQIIARINSHFGYGAIGDIRIIQGPIKPLTASNSRNFGANSIEGRVDQHATADDLVSALERLGEQVKARKIRR